MYSFNIKCEILNNDSHPKHENLFINDDSISKALNKLTTKVHELVLCHSYHNIKVKINGIDIEFEALKKFNVDEDEFRKQFEYFRHIFMVKFKIKKMFLENKENYVVFSFKKYCIANKIGKDVLKNWITKNNLYFFENDALIITKHEYKKYEEAIKIGIKVNFDINNPEYTKFRNFKLEKYIKNKIKHLNKKFENDDLKISIEIKNRYFKSNANKFNNYSLQELIDEFNKEESEFLIPENYNNLNIRKLQKSINRIKQDNGDWGSKNSPIPVNPHPHPY